MVRLIDSFLNNITMYRLVLYGLILLSCVSILLGFLRILPYSGISYLITLLLLLITCYLSNTFFAKIYKATTNNESSAITALILFCIVAPVANNTDIYVTIAAGFIAIASKYLLAINKKHIFNPAGFSIFLLGLLGFGNAIWWIGSGVLLPFVLLIGLLIVRKIRRFYLLWAFLVTGVITIVFFNLGNNMSVLDSVQQVFFSWPLIFFGTIMLTEPLTTPPTRKLYVLYGGLVGVLFGLQFHIGPLFASPEFALFVGNIFSYIVSPKYKLFPKFVKKIELAPNIYEFQFTKNSNFTFIPGQYLEWTVPLVQSDTRGNRRYFTVASSPTEKDIKLGVKIGEQSSAFKKWLSTMTEGSQIVASQLTGDFTLPKDINKKLVFIAGGIGVTPFRSMIQYLLDTKEKRDIVFFCACSHGDEFVYKDIFKTAEKEMGIKIIYVVTNKQNVPKNWDGEVGYLDKETVTKYVPDYKDRMYYLSGPNIMVESYKKILKAMGVSRKNIITDYFPGF